MKKYAALSVIGVLAIMLALQGCNKPNVDPATIAMGLNLAGKNGAYYGLVQWAKTKPEAANECATKLAENINDVLIPYLKGDSLPSSAEVAAMIDSSLFKNVPEEVKDAIVAVSVALDVVMPIPDSKTYLTKDQVNYIKSFLGGLADGAEKFAGAKALKGEFGTHWIK